MNNQNYDIPINLNYEESPELFGADASNWAEKINREAKSQKNKSTQIRLFYNKVCELNEQNEGLTKEEYKKTIYPFLVMLKSKVKYAKTRGLVSVAFVNMINMCVVNCENNPKSLNNFKLFFEAVIGFYPKK